MKFEYLPSEVVVKCLQGLGPQDLSCLLDVFPHFKPLVIYSKYSGALLTSSAITKQDLSYMKSTNLIIHPDQIIIDTVDEYFLNFLNHTFKVAFDLSRLSDFGFYKKFLTLTDIPVDIYTATNLEDISGLNVRILKFTRIPQSFEIPANIHHLDASLIGIDDKILANVTFPASLKSLNLSNNCIKRVDDQVLKISHLNQLKMLDLSNNDIYYFNLPINPSLQLLNLSSNLIFNTSFIMNGLNAYLEWLNLSYNLITSLIPTPNKINRIELYGNYL